MTLIEVLTAHTFNLGTCQCGWQGNRYSHAEHVADHIHAAGFDVTPGPTRFVSGLT